MGVRLHFALERARPHATLFRFDGDGQFGTWQEARSGDPRAVAFYTADDVRRIMGDAASPCGVMASPLSDFVRNTTPEKKAEVFGRVMDKVADQQQAVIDAASGVAIPQTPMVNDHG